MGREMNFGPLFKCRFSGRAMFTDQLLHHQYHSTRTRSVPAHALADTICRQYQWCDSANPPTFNCGARIRAEKRQTSLAKAPERLGFR